MKHHWAFMLLHNILYCVHFLKIQKRNSKSIWKMLWNIRKGKKKRIFIFLPGFGLVQQQPASTPRPASRARSPLLSHARSFLGRAAVAGLVRANAPSLSAPSLTSQARTSGRLLPSHDGIGFLSKLPPIRFHLPNLPLSILGAASGL
jgi:hypothetical protein